jgi:hypothetical protein
MTQNSSPIGRRDIWDFYLKRPKYPENNIWEIWTTEEQLKCHINIGELV